MESNASYRGTHKAFSCYTSKSPARSSRPTSRTYRRPKRFFSHIWLPQSLPLSLLCIHACPLLRCCTAEHIVKKQINKQHKADECHTEVLPCMSNSSSFVPVPQKSTTVKRVQAECSISTNCFRIPQSLSEVITCLHSQLLILFPLLCYIVSQGIIGIGSAQKCLDAVAQTHHSCSTHAVSLTVDAFESSKVTTACNFFLCITRKNVMLNEMLLQHCLHVQVQRTDLSNTVRI